MQKRTMTTDVYSDCQINVKDYTGNSSIYGMSGFDSINLKCAGSTNTSSLTSSEVTTTTTTTTTTDINLNSTFVINTVCDDIRFYCGTSFNHRCNIMYNKTTTNYQCSGICSDFDATAAPSSTPTASPSVPPTNAPSISPSNSPTTIPTHTPSLYPTMDPTSAPSKAPTRLPTVYDDYTIEIDVNLNFYNVSYSKTITEIFDKFEQKIYTNLKNILEENYSKIGQDDLKYSEFDIIFKRVTNSECNRTIKWQKFYSNISYFDNGDESDSTESSGSSGRDNGGSGGNGGKNCDTGTSDVIVVITTIYCLAGGAQYQLQAISSDEEFLDITTNEVTRLFSNETDIVFRVDMDSWISKDISESSGESDNNTNDAWWADFDLMVYILGALCLFLTIVTMLAAVHTSLRLCLCFGLWCPCCRPMDGVITRRLWIYGLQVWDLFSDIYFAFNIMKLSHEKNGENMVIFAISILSPIFIIIPYFANMHAATNLYKTHIVLNKIARLYFEQRLVFFGSLVLLSGGVQPSVQLVSSKLFGLAVFDCGLSERELLQFIRVHLTHSVLIENLPQLIIQCVYISEIGTIDEPVMFALVASLFSLLNAIFTYSSSKQVGVNELIVTLYVDFTNRNNLYNKPNFLTLSTPAPKDQIFKRDIRRFLSRMGFRQFLGIKIAEALGVMEKKIDVFSVVKTQNGCQIHLSYILDAPQARQYDQISHQPFPSQSQKLQPQQQQQHPEQLHQQTLVSQHQSLPTHTHTIQLTPSVRAQNQTPSSAIHSANTSVNPFAIASANMKPFNWTPVITSASTIIQTTTDHAATQGETPKIVIEKFIQATQIKMPHSHRSKSNPNYNNNNPSPTPSNNSPNQVPSKKTTLTIDGDFKDSRSKSKEDSRSRSWQLEYDQNSISNGSAIGQACKEVWQLERMPRVTVYVDDVFEDFEDSDDDTDDSHSMSDLDIGSSWQDGTLNRNKSGHGDNGSGYHSNYKNKSNQNRALRRNLNRAETQLQLQFQMQTNKNNGRHRGDTVMNINKLTMMVFGKLKEDEKEKNKEQEEKDKEKQNVRGKNRSRHMRGVPLTVSAMDDTNAALWKTKYKQLKKEFKQYKRSVYRPKLRVSNAEFRTAKASVDANGVMMYTFGEITDDEDDDDDDDDGKFSSNEYDDPYHDQHQNQHRSSADNDDEDYLVVEEEKDKHKEKHKEKERDQLQYKNTNSILMQLGRKISTTYANNRNGANDYDSDNDKRSGSNKNVDNKNDAARASIVIITDMDDEPQTVEYTAKIHSRKLNGSNDQTKKSTHTRRHVSEWL